jgi:hypothetical protein
MVNIKYFVDGTKYLENEYDSTAFTNFNDLISKKIIDTDKIYKISIARIYENGGHVFYKEYYLIPSQPLKICELDGSKCYAYMFASEAAKSSKWKIYFNAMPNLKYAEIHDSIDGKITKYSRIIEKNTDISNIVVYKNYMVDIEILVLNGVEVNYIRYDDLLVCNIIVRKLKLSKEINQIKNNYNYCVIF